MDNIGYGIDTIKASVALPRRITLLRDAFDVISNHDYSNGSINRWVIKPDTHETSPRLTYYPDNNRLICEVSLPKYLRYENVNGVADEELCQAYQLLDEKLSALSSQALPSIKTWSIRRVDYVTGWYVGEQLLDYIEAIGKRELAKYEKTFFTTGVRWQTKSRRINLYDKYAQDGTGQGLLRCEIQNYPAAIRYMEKRWFHLPRTVENYTTEHMAKTVMLIFFNQLQINKLNTIPDDAKLREAFGRRWAQAKVYRELIVKHGKEAYKQNLLSTASFYRYKNELIKYNLLGNAGTTHLAPLSLE